jgi:hypothetical protein
MRSRPAGTRVSWLGLLACVRRGTGSSRVTLLPPGNGSTGPEKLTVFFDLHAPCVSLVSSSTVTAAGFRFVGSP